jgi:large subunit ribosomal protein L25
MQTVTLEAKDRASLGTSNSRRLRRDGLIPAVLYGKKQPNVHITLDAEAFDAAVRHHSRVLDLKLPGGTMEKAIIKEVQWDTFGDEVLHVDLGRIALDDKIHIRVPLRFTGDPKGVAAGGHLEVQIHEPMIECLAGAIPEDIRIDVSHLELDQIMRVRDVKGLPAGVKLLQLEDAVVCHVKPPHIEVLPEVAAPEAAAAAAEPEVIAKGKKEEEGEGEAAPEKEGGKEKK